MIGSMKSKLKGAVREFRTGFKGTPLISVMEAVVNSIQAADSPRDAHIHVKIHYEYVQQRLGFEGGTNSDGKSYIKSIEIIDDGHGFSEKYLEAFDELYTECKKELGCKGIGRITWLAVFDHVEIDSYCSYNGERSHVRFNFDEDNEITNKVIEPTDTTKNETTVKLVGVRPQYRDKIKTNAEKLAGQILDHCLSYYISGNYPSILVEDLDGTFSVTDFFDERNYNVQKEEMKVLGTEFSINHLLSKSIKTKSNATAFYCANGRVVKDDAIIKGPIADSEEQFYSYILYLSGNYLDENVSSDRLTFTIPSRSELHDPEQPTVEDIAEAVENKAKTFLGPILDGYNEKCKQRADKYVTEHPEFKYVLTNRPGILEDITPNAENDEMYKLFNKTFADLESEYVFDFEKAAKGSFDWKDDDERTVFFKKISDTQQAILAKYMSHRKYIINLFEKQLRIYQDANMHDKYAEEGKIHDILMPRKMTADDLSFDNCNMWMIDERLNYYSYTSAAYSDRPFKSYTNVDEEKRPDICIFSDKRGD